MTAQGKTEGRHPGSSLPPPFYDPERVAQKPLVRFVSPLQGGMFLGDRIPRVADCVLTLGCHVLPFQGDSATILNAIIISNAMWPFDDKNLAYYMLAKTLAVELVRHEIIGDY